MLQICTESFLLQDAVGGSSLTLDTREERSMKVASHRSRESPRRPDRLARLIEIPIPFRLEMGLWSALVRTLLATMSTERAIALLDALPHRHATTRPLAIPPERGVRFAGACLGRSLARSQYLRLRGHPHHLVIGVKGQIHDFQAHAWLDGDPLADDYVELRRIER